MTASPEDFHDVPIGPGTTPVYRKVSLFCAGRDGHDGTHNEDRVVLQPTAHGTVLAVVDGVTPRTSVKLYDDTLHEYGVSAGRLAARIAERHIRQLAPGMTLPQLVQAMYGDWQLVKALPSCPPQEIVGAVFAVLVPWEGEHGAIWVFGDCLWGFRQGSPDGPWTDSLGGGAQTSSADALIRKAAIEAELQRRGITPAERQDLIRTDIALRSALATCGRQAVLARRRAQNGQSWLDRWTTAQRLMRPVQLLPGDVTVLTLATDGSVSVPRTMDEGLAALRTLREADPLMMGDNPFGVALAKGFTALDGVLYPHPDDMGIVVALR